MMIEPLKLCHICGKPANSFIDFRSIPPYLTEGEQRHSEDHHPIEGQNRECLCLDHVLKMKHLMYKEKKRNDNI